MNTRKFENEKEFNNWYNNTIEGYPMVFEFGEFDSPMMYPCIIVYETLDKPFIDDADAEEQFNDLLNEGYCRDEIEEFIYHYVYPTDFD